MFMKFFFSFSLLIFRLAAFSAEPLNLNIISYDGFIRNDPESLLALRKALFEKGIVGIRDIPGYTQKIAKLIEAARIFSHLSDAAKEQYSRKPGEMFLGYELGKEKFRLSDGTWVVDDQKASYYALIPDCIENKWPNEIDLRSPFQEMGMLMREMGISVMEKIGLLSPHTNISLVNEPAWGRMLTYRKAGDTAKSNPLWCGAHYDHGLFTVLLPAFYFIDESLVEEPEEAGLFVQSSTCQEFQKVVTSPDVMLFQVGEFGQLVSNDAIRATKHQVQKAHIERIERYTMATFFGAPMDTVVFSHSELTNDSRYGAGPGEPCTYQHWHEASFNRYIVED